MKVWHISDTHLSFDENWVPLKPMHERKWAVGVWTYERYLEKMSTFGLTVIEKEDFVFITGDIVHDMKIPETENSMRWLRHNIKGTLIICRGNHDKFWQPGKMRQLISDLPNFYILDEGEIITIGTYTIGCFSNHSAKTQDFSFVDERYLETAISTVKQANAKNTIPVMISHYPVNLMAAQAIGKAGIKAYMSGHIHITDGISPESVGGLNWDWYSKSAAYTDDLKIEGCFYSTATTDVVLAKHGQSFKEIKCLGIKDPEALLPPAEEMIILCGLPGSGKSTIAEVFRERYEFVRVNQDDLKSKKRCIRVVEAALKNSRSVIIDRCNFDAPQRKVWVDLAKSFKVKKIRAVELLLPINSCIERVIERKGHPTLSGELAANNVIGKIQSMFTSPTKKEGFHDVLQLNTDSLTEKLDTIIDTIQNPEKYSGR